MSKVASYDEGNSQERQKSSFYFGFRILGNFYRLAGLAVFSDNRDVRQLQYKWRTVWPWAVYSFILFSLVLLSLVLYIVAFVKFLNESGQALDFNNLFNVGLFFHLSVNYLMMTIHSTVHRHAILHNVQSLHNLELEVGFGVRQKWIIALSAVALLVGHLIYSVTTFLHINDRENIFFEVFAISSSTHLGLTVIFFIWTFVAITAIFMIPTLLIFLSAFFRRCFCTINTRLHTIGEIVCSETQCTCAQSVAVLRNVYVHVVDCVTQCNGIMSVGVLINYSANVVLCCFAISLAVRDTNHSQVIMFLELFTAGMIRMLVPLWFIGLMQSAEQSLGMLIGKLSNRSQCKDFVQELGIFKTHLQSNQVTFSGCGIFQLNLPLILSIIQTVITYAVILYQTQPPDMSNLSFNCSKQH